MLARKNNLTVARRSEAAGHQRDSGFGRLDIGMVAEGQYQNLRRFIYDIEQAPTFLVIDDLTIDQARAQDALVLSLRLSTYYRMANDAK